MLLGGVAGGVYQPQHESSAASSSTSTTSSSTTATIACAVQVIDKKKVDYNIELSSYNHQMISLSYCLKYLIYGFLQYQVIHSNPTSPCSQNHILQTKQEAKSGNRDKHPSYENVASPSQTNISAQSGKSIKFTFLQKSN